MSKELITEAIEKRQILEFFYDNNKRIVEPLIIGQTSKNKVTLLSIQIGGESSSSAMPNWRMFEIDKIKDIKFRRRTLPNYFEAYEKTDQLLNNKLSTLLSQRKIDISSEQLQDLLKDFELLKKTHQDNTYWSAKGLSSLLGYTSWRSFTNIIRRVRGTFNLPTSHFVGHEHDILLTRSAAFALSDNIKSCRSTITLARLYFANIEDNVDADQTHMALVDKVKAKMQSTETEKYLSTVIYNHGIKQRDFGAIRSAGDSGFFGGYNTLYMKARLGIKNTQSLVNALPTVVIKAREFAAALTGYNVKALNLQGLSQIRAEHVKNCLSVRQMLLKNSIQPESKKLLI